MAQKCGNNALKMVATRNVFKNCLFFCSLKICKNKSLLKFGNNALKFDNHAYVCVCVCGRHIGWRKPLAYYS